MVCPRRNPLGRKFCADQSFTKDAAWAEGLIIVDAPGAVDRDHCVSCEPTLLDNAAGNCPGPVGTADADDG